MIRLILRLKEELPDRGQLNLMTLNSMNVLSNFIKKIKNLTKSLPKFENERIISFTPPDGDFDLISYRLDVRVKPLFTVDVIIESNFGISI